METPTPKEFRAVDASDARPGERSRRARTVRLLIPKPEGSPYFEIAETDWVTLTRQLIDAYPLDLRSLTDSVLGSWNQIFSSSIGAFSIGKDIRPSPQVMGNLLHELIPLNLAHASPQDWRRGSASDEKDLVYLTDPRFSTEIKTSSHPNQIFGNRSYAQDTDGESKKLKSGYYLAINFSGFGLIERQHQSQDPIIKRIRFGWLEHLDWFGQAAASGQQASLAPKIEDAQLLTIYLVE